MSNPIIAAQLYTVREFMQTPSRLPRVCEKLGKLATVQFRFRVDRLTLTSLRISSNRNS